MAETEKSINNRNLKIISIILVILGILMAVGPWTIFPVCNNGASTMVCHYTAEAEIVVGSLVTLLGLLLFLIKRSETLLIVGIAEAALGIWAILIPTYLIGICKGVSMECETVGGPVLVVLGGLTFLLSLFLILKGRKG
jgi:hypothetical protein